LVLTLGPHRLAASYDEALGRSPPQVVVVRIHHPSSVIRPLSFSSALLAYKSALITGSGTGLGRALAERLLQPVATVVICGRRAEVLESAATEMMKEFGGRVIAIPCDIRDPLAVDAMISKAWDDCGGIDILVNNAAGNIAAPTEKLSHRAV